MIIIADKEKYEEKEKLYLTAREIEHRIISDELLQQLPSPPDTYMHAKEWKIRAVSCRRFLKSLKNQRLQILDIGCGNGWMSHLLSMGGNTVTGMDLNITELEQAERVFGNNQHLQWMYADVMHNEITTSYYDLILLAASCQYFPDIVALTNKLKSLLKKGGSIHLIDSFFYNEDEIHIAKERTVAYYAGIGVPEMSNYYFHHSQNTLKKLGFKKRYPIFKWTKKPEWWVLEV